MIEEQWLHTGSAHAAAVFAQHQLALIEIKVNFCVAVNPLCVRLLHSLEFLTYLL